MFKKIIKPLIVALFFYIITVLYGLISFNPLPVIFYRGIRAFIIGFCLSLILKLVVQYLNSRGNADMSKSNSKDNNQIKEKEVGEHKDSTKSNDSSEADKQNNEKKFNPLDPPFLETEED